MTMSRPSRAASSSDVRATCTGSVDSDHTGTPTRSPSTRSCSTAAGRCRSAPTSNGRRPWLFSNRASFADAVVFPEPWRPAIMITVGGFDETFSLPVVPPSVATSSSLTILMTCCAGLRLFATSAPVARSLTRVMKLRATFTFTSASRRATRSSRATSSMSFSVSLPRLRSLRKTPSSRSESASNIANEAMRRLLEQRVDEVRRLERDEVGCRLAEADQLHRDAELRLDGENDPALGRAVELGEHDTRDVDHLGELLRLGEPVLARGGIEDEQHLLERAGCAVDDALELLELVHQVDLGVQTSGGVDEDEVGVAALGRAHRVEDHRPGIGALLPAHDARAHHVGPVGELLGGCGAEGVSSGEDDGVAVVHLVV